ncbi:AMP-binding protein [Streptomyces sp. NPDC017940]|uniref:alpha/beta hydrolase family protein n=1 Tax=Streptomyces sp. NPDC017940 TaxID=3365017 RepID=UPI00378E6F90
MSKAAPYGAWNSPVSAADVAATDSHPNWPGFVGDEIWWSERLPEEGGRTTLMRAEPGGGAHSALPAPWNVRSRVMEYGGRAWAGAATGDGPLIVFVHADDQRLYRLDPAAPGAAPRPLTPVGAPGAASAFVDPVLPAAAGAVPTEVWCVREQTAPGGVPVRELVAVPLDGSAAGDGALVRTLARGHDFLTGPRVAPDGRHVAWIGWDHPDMPWDASEACVAEIRGDGTLAAARVVAGGPGESVAQVEWTDDGDLYVITDRSGWWNVHRADVGEHRADIGVHRADPRGGAPRVVAVCPREEEFAGALTKIGFTWCAPLPGGRLAVVHGTHSLSLSVLDPASGELSALPCPFTEYEPLLVSRGHRLVAIGARADRDFTAVCVDTSDGTCTTLSQPRATVPADLLPVPEARTFHGSDGRPVHAVVLPPRNPGFTGPPGELPPYVVFAHSGPTSRFPMAYDLRTAFLTSRGIGVVGVNYSGSTGYGRQYRERLRHAWGIADVADCALVAEALAAEGAADRDRLAIRGASAGGWTAAVSLTILDTYRCAALHYPVLDPVTWRNTQNHGFEAFYLDTLVGPWPEAENDYLTRSPAHAADRVDVPFLLFQGSADPICPPAQAERFLAGVRPEAAPYRHLVFDGERHGFKRSTTVVECVEAELALFREAFGVREVPGASPAPDALDAPEAETVHGLVADRAARAPERIAVQDATGSWTYAELLARADDLGVLLRRAGVRPGDRVGIHLDRTRDLVAGLLAALRAGCSYLPLDPEYPADRLRFMIEDARPAAVLTRRTLPEPPHGGGTRLVHVDEPGTPRGGAAGLAPVVCSPDQPAFVIYTSGSTGTPKGAVLAHRGIVNVLRHSRDAFGFTEDDSVLAMAAFSFDFAQLELLLPLISGGTVQLLDRAAARDPELLEAALDARRASFVMGTPSMFAALTAFGWRPPRGVSVVSGGESLTPALAEALAPAAALWNIYGPTETSIFSLYERVPTSGGPGAAVSVRGELPGAATSASGELPGAAVSVPGQVPGGADITIGRPVPHTVVEILRDGERCADGETGEIHLGGPGLALGYLDRPELTAARFLPDPFRPGERLYRTGDLGRRLPDGRIAYEGRADDQVKIRGHRVEPGEVEGWLLRHPAVRAAAVVAERGHHALRLVAYVVLAEGVEGVADAERTGGAQGSAGSGGAERTGGAQDSAGPGGVEGGVAGLRAHLARHLPVHALPHRVVAVPEIPLSPNGKTDRRALSAVARPRPAGAEGLAGVWRDVLGVTGVTAADNFFALGGDSLSAMEMTIRARDLGIQLRVADLYGTRTFGELADTVGMRDPARSAVPTATAELPTALSPAQLRFLEWDYRDADHYNVSLLLDVADTVDRDALRASLDALAERHPALRLRLTGPAGAPVPVTDRPSGAPLSWHELPGTDDDDAVERAFLKEADLLQQSLSLREGPVWRAAFFAGSGGHRLLLVFHHFIADGMSLKIIARDLGALYAAGADAERGAVPPAPASSWAAHAGTLRRFANGPLDEFFVRRWESLPWSQCAPLPADRPDGSMHLSHVRAFDTEVPLPAGISAPRQEELLISAVAAAVAEESGARAGAVEVCRHGRTDPTGGPGHFDAVGWLNSITPYVLALPEPGADDGATAAALRAQITEIRDLEQTWGALRHLHDDAGVRARLAALPAPDVYLNFLGSHMYEREPAGPFRPRHGDVGTEMTLDRTQPYRIKIYAETAPAPVTVRLKWQYSADVDDESRIRRVAASCARHLDRLARCP